MRPRIPAVALLVILAPVALRAGGPAFIAGSGFDPGIAGQPIVWANASVQYYTDQGDLSPILTNAQADALVATAIASWTSAPGVGLTVTQAGHLAEDVTGSNIQVTDSVIAAPPISRRPQQLRRSESFMTTTAPSPMRSSARVRRCHDCFTNAVYGGPDKFAVSGNIAHALAVINGVCASTSAQLPDVQYRLVRVLGRIFGLGWSQANINVLTNAPPPTEDDFQGFPVMHFADPVSCVPISHCYPNAAVPKLDDISALASLYPRPAAIRSQPADSGAACTSPTAPAAPHK